jgi:hypothetical protein
MYTYLMVRKSSVARDISSGPSSTSIKSFIKAPPPRPVFSSFLLLLPHNTSHNNPKGAVAVLLRSRGDGSASALLLLLTVYTTLARWPALRSLVAVVCAVRLPRPQQHPRGLNPNPRSLQVR